MSLFQSSPDPKVGCYNHRQHAIDWVKGFNPHPTRRSGATSPLQSCAPARSFQSSPDPKVGCYSHYPYIYAWGPSFQSSPDPKVGCYDRQNSGRRDSRRFNPHPTRRSGATRPRQVAKEQTHVSILTRPEGRVLRAGPGLWQAQTWFQSSPDPKVGCYPPPFRRPRSTDRFNPHPTRRSGAT